MSKNFEFKLNYQGVRSLLHSHEMREVLLGYGQAIAKRAGDGYEAKNMATRVIAVSTATDKARKDNLKNNTLLKATGSSKK